MGRTRQGKEAIVTELKGLLSGSQMALVMDYQGLDVSEIGSLRDRLYEKGAVCKVTKNTLMQKAIDGDENWTALSELLKGTNAFILVQQDDLGGAIKAYKEFQKVSKKTELRGGVLEGKVLSPKQVDVIGDLPTKAELIAQVAGAVNSIVANIATVVNEIPTGVARAVQAVADKNAA